MMSDRRMYSIRISFVGLLRRRVGRDHPDRRVGDLRLPFGEYVILIVHQWQRVGLGFLLASCSGGCSK